MADGFQKTMKLQIDNLDGAGLRDYTADIDASRTPRLSRTLNAPSQLHFSLLSIGADFIVPKSGARVTLGRTNGQDVFTGYITGEAEYEYLGWGERGAVYRYNYVAQSDEVMLDRKRLSARSPFVARSAGDALRQLTQNAVAGGFDTSGVQDLDTLVNYVPDPQEPWSKHAALIASQARASYRVLNGAVSLVPIGATVYQLNESDANFSPQGLILQPGNAVTNDVTVVGEIEPEAYVRDYFVGDDLTTRFYLSQTPFTKGSTTVFDEEYTNSALDPARWSVSDLSSAVVAGDGKLQIAGGTGADGGTTVTFAEKIELGGSWVLEHGDVQFTSAVSSGILGGLYLGNISVANCLAGFRISPAGSSSQIQGLINGATVGAALSTVSSHHYVFATRIFSQEIYRQQQIFHCAANPSGSGIGGAQVNADVRIVLEVQDVDPGNPATLVAPATVLYDGVISGAPGYCTYALVNSQSLYCSIFYSRLIQATDVEVRTALPDQPYSTRLVGPLSAGCECNVISGSTLSFFTAYVPVLNEAIEVHYRGQRGDPLLLTSGRALARVTNPASITALEHGIDNGVRSAVRRVKYPPARTSVDCENAVLALLSDGASAGWTGEYEVWSGFLPGGAQDIFPGDALAINVPSCSADFKAIVRAVEVTFADLEGDNSRYKIQFADDSARTLSFEFETAKITSPLNVNAITSSQVGLTTLPDLTGAQAILPPASTAVSIDAGLAPVSGGGIEVRWSDSGWGPYNDENLAGRFTTQTFTLPRLSKVQSYFLRQFDASTPPRYSRHSAALHLDYPF